VKFWQEVDGLLLRQAAKYADAIRAAFIRSINVADIVERWTQAYPAGGLVSAAEARQWARQNIPVQRKPLADIIEHIYATGWVMGQDVSTAAYAHAQLGIKKAAPSAKDLKYALNINWDNWKPGNRPASLLVRPSGKFSQLLEQGRVSIKGMNDTTLDRVGTLLADTLESGAGYSELARNLLKDQITSRVVTDASRAGTIAVTEMSRALNTATVDNYKQFGVEKVEWLAIDTGVCDICPANEAQGPIPIGQMFESGDTEPPAHPNCRCTVVPIVDEGPEMTDEQFAQAIMDGEAPALEPISTEPIEPLPKYDIPAVTIDDIFEPSANSERVAELKKVYEGRTYGKGFTTQVLEVNKVSNTIKVDMRITSADGVNAGRVKRTFTLDADNNSVYHDIMRLEDQFKGQGFSSDFSRFSEAWYRVAGINRIDVTAALQDGSYTWAKAGYDWSIRPESLIRKINYKIEYMLEIFEKYSIGLTRDEAENAAKVVRGITAKLATGKITSANYPKPFELANLDLPDLQVTIGGEKITQSFSRWLLEDTFWDGTKVL
jgi:SPP1 gp7 family putative phage head morphogenesis protein